MLCGFSKACLAHFESGCHEKFQFKTKKHENFDQNFSNQILYPSYDVYDIKIKWLHWKKWTGKPPQNFHSKEIPILLCQKHVNFDIKKMLAIGT